RGDRDLRRALHGARDVVLLAVSLHGNAHLLRGRHRAVALAPRLLADVDDRESPTVFHETLALAEPRVVRVARRAEVVADPFVFAGLLPRAHCLVAREDVRVEAEVLAADVGRNLLGDADDGTWRDGDVGGRNVERRVRGEARCLES